jgi:hypothetical protein
MFAVLEPIKGCLVKIWLSVLVPLFVGLLWLGACSSEEATPNKVKPEPIGYNTN